MLTEKIDWNQVDDALSAAESAKNHYKHFQHLTELVSVVKQAKTLLDAAQRDKQVIEDKITAARVQLQDITAQVDQAQTATTAEIAKLQAALAVKREELSAMARNGTDKLSALDSAHKDLLLRANETRTRLAQDLAERQTAADAAHAQRLAAQRLELDALLDERTKLADSLAQLRRDAAVIAGR